MGCLHAIMRELLLLRHAKSTWDDSSLTDHQRPLNARGRAAAPLMGRLLRDEDLVPDLILSSDSARTRETVALLSDAMTPTGRTHFLPSLYHASPATIMGVLSEYGDADRVLVVAHNPGLQELASALIGTVTSFPTAALAAFVCEDETFTLKGLWRPKELLD